ncbi:MAG: conjugal transfer protein [Pseudonocardiales bacterium]|nr:conjugal transfer protein [Pseudonocardiales bacterium]
MIHPSPLVADVRRRLADVPAETLSAATFAARRGAGILADDAVLARWEHDLAAQLHGAGPLEPLLALPGVTDVLVNSPDEVYIDCGDGLVRVAVTFASDDDIRGLAARLAAAAGRRLDDAQPFVDAHLPDGTRLHAILPPLAEHPTLSLRVLGRRRLELIDLVAGGTLSSELAELLQAIVTARLAFLISGGTGSGKTTVLAALLGQVAADQRIVTIEDAAEIVTSHPHVVRLVTRSANVEGAGAVGLRELVRQALRMRPDRVVVGEFRGAEIVDLLAALNTGHAGGGATVHANSVGDVPARLEALGALGGLDRQSLTAQAAAAFDVVLHLGRDEFGQRQLEEIGWLTRSGDAIAVANVWSRVAGRGPAARALAARLPKPAPLILDEVR